MAPVRHTLLQPLPLPLLQLHPQATALRNLPLPRNPPHTVPHTPLHTVLYTHPHTHSHSHTLLRMEALAQPSAAFARTPYQDSPQVVQTPYHHFQAHRPTHHHPLL